jgi:hypothetical protein
MTAYKSHTSSHSEEKDAAAAFLNAEKYYRNVFCSSKQVYPNTLSFVITHLHLTASLIDKKIDIKQEANRSRSGIPGGKAH